MPSTHSVVMAALLPIAIKKHNIPQQLLEELLQTTQDVLNDVLRRVHQPLTLKQNPGAESGYYKVICANGNFRRCKPVLTAWLADWPRYGNLHHLERHVCSWCECPINNHGYCVPSDKQHPRWDHNVSRTLSDADTKGANAELSLCHVHQGLDVFQHFPCIMSDLPKPDLLHTMQIGMLDYLRKLIFHFMKRHGRLDKYNAIWLSVPPYHNLTPKNMSYKAVSQWNGKEMKKMSGYLLGVGTQSQRGRSPAQRHISNDAIECTRALLEFYMFAQYKSHNDATLSYMEDTLGRLHTFKDLSYSGETAKRRRPRPILRERNS